MKTQQIFNYIKGLNAPQIVISSLGSYTSDINRQVSDNLRGQIMQYLPETSLAYKICMTANTFSEKQLWVIAFELIKNADFCEVVAEFYAEINQKETIKKAQSDAKLAANKANSQSVLDVVKSNGKKLGDFYEFVKNSKQFKKEFYSKKFSMDSANAFLSI